MTYIIETDVPPPPLRPKPLDLSQLKVGDRMLAPMDRTPASIRVSVSLYQRKKATDRRFRVQKERGGIYIYRVH